MDVLRRTILVSACSLAFAGAAWAQSTGQGSSVTLRPVDTGRSVTSAGRDGSRPVAATRSVTRSRTAAGLRTQPTRFAIKTNLVYAAALQTPNLAFEYAPGGRSTVELAVGYNNWGNLWDNKTTGPAYDPTNSYKRRLNHLFVKGEYRYWFRGPFEGFFAGAGVFYANYRTGEIKVPGLFDNAGFDYFGRLLGAQLTGGWLWRWHRRWATEFSLGVGAATARHEQGLITTAEGTYQIANPVRVNNTYVGPTSVAVKMVFLIE